MPSLHSVLTQYKMSPTKVGMIGEQQLEWTQLDTFQAQVLFSWLFFRSILSLLRAIFSLVVTSETTSSITCTSSSHVRIRYCPRVFRFIEDDRRLGYSASQASNIILYSQRNDCESRRAPMIYHAPRARDGYLCCSLHMIMQQFSMQDCILSNTTIHQPALLQVKIGHPQKGDYVGIVLNLVKVSSIDTVNIDIWCCITHLKQCCLAPGVRIQKEIVHSKSTFCITKKKSVHYNFKTNTRKSETATNISCWTCIYTCCLACIIVYS